MWSQINPVSPPFFCRLLRWSLATTWNSAPAFFAPKRLLTCVATSIHHSTYFARLSRVLDSSRARFFAPRTAVVSPLPVSRLVPTTGARWAPTPGWPGTASGWPRPSSTSREFQPSTKISSRLPAEATLTLEKRALLLDRLVTVRILQFGAPIGNPDRLTLILYKSISHPH